MERLAQVLTFLAALGSGLMAGLFFIFSITIMASLAKLTPANGIAAMQSINVTILGGTFLSVFMGTALICLVLIVAWFLGWVPSGGVYVFAGSIAYLVGIIGVTMVFNVPLNDALMTIQPESTEAAAHWQQYLSSWMPWNHVRTVAGIASLALFILGFRG
jgi:uncharacterized membrane protein